LLLTYSFQFRSAAHAAPAPCTVTSTSVTHRQPCGVNNSIDKLHFKMAVKRGVCLRVYRCRGVGSTRSTCHSRRTPRRSSRVLASFDSRTPCPRPNILHHDNHNMRQGRRNDIRGPVRRYPLRSFSMITRYRRPLPGLSRLVFEILDDVRFFGHSDLVISSGHATSHADRWIRLPVSGFLLVFYGTINDKRWRIFTCAQKLAYSQLNLPHGTKQKRLMKKLKIKTEMLRRNGPVTIAQ